MKQHTISLFQAVLMNINIMVGAGILVGPGQMAAISGNASFLGWPIIALVFLPIVLSTMQLSRMFPGAGGFCSYAKQGLNDKAGFLSGWLYILGYTFAASVEILALKQPLAVLLGNNWLLDSPIIFNAIVLVICIGLNLLGVRALSSILGSLTIFKLIPPIVLILLIPFIFNPSFTITGHELSMLPYCLPMAIFGYLGFEYCCSISHMIEDSEKNAPRALIIGFLVTAFLFTLFHFGVLNLMGTQNLTQYSASAFAQFINLPIPYLRQVLAILIPVASAITFFAGTNGMISANAVLLHAMAQEKMFKFVGPLFSETNAVGRPWIVIVIQSLVIFLIATFIPHISIVGSLCNLGVFMSFLLPFVSLLLIQQRSAIKNTKILLTLLALSVTIGLVSYSWYTIGTTITERVLYSLPFFAVVLFGLFLRQDEKLRV